jgi:O-antigen ligase
VGVWLLATALYSTDPQLTIKRAIIFNFGLVTIFTLVHITPRPARLMQLVVAAITMTSAWVSIAGWFIFPASAVSIAERPGLAGVTGHPNTLAPAMVVGFLVSLAIPRPGRAGLLAFRFGQVGLIIALIMTNSITSIVLLLVGLLVFVILTSSSYRRGIAQLILTAVLLVVAFVGLGNLKSWFFGAVNRDPSLSGRDELWVSVLREGLKEPLFGQGFGAFWYEGRGREIVGNWNPRQSHNAFVDVFVDLGAIGTAVVVGTLLATLVRGWLRARGAPGSAQRRAAASMIAVAAGLFGVYALGESFLLELDKLPMFCLLWFACLLGNRDTNRLEAEFPDGTRPLGPCRRHRSDEAPFHALADRPSGT